MSILSVPKHFEVRMAIEQLMGIADFQITHCHLKGYQFLFSLQPVLHLVGFGYPCSVYRQSHLVKQSKRALNYHKNVKL